ncbi:MAG: magnesium/cobalt transporter CorA [Cyanobacteriota bacterium]|nr:magnesium/cobalt transporter CorA [Cyanobacteriota bacterium]
MTQRRLLDANLATQLDEEEDLFDYYYDEQGSMPGTLKIPKNAPQPEIVLIDYSETERTRVQLEKPEDSIVYLDTASVSWVDVLGLGSEDVLRRLGKVFKLHPLVLEDIVNVPQRPKVEDYEDHVVIISQMVLVKDNGAGFWVEQVSLVLGKHYLLTVQEEPSRDCFQPVRDRIRAGKGSIRKQGPDYLAYTLIDAIIDGFFPVLEAYGERIEELEDEVVTKPTRRTIEKIYQIRRELLALRRAIWPQRDAINSLIRDGSDLISPDVQVYLRDCYDHAVQVMDMVETYRELTSGLMDIYLSSVGNKMNEIMKLLTVISSIFIPLTFIAGVYGMNFNTEKSPLNMPELNWYWGYPACLGFMAATAIGLIFFFWRRGWFENFSTIKKE